MTWRSIAVPTNVVAARLPRGWMRSAAYCDLLAGGRRALVAVAD